jgi:hypothetical protein
MASEKRAARRYRVSTPAFAFFPLAALETLSPIMALKELTARRYRIPTAAFAPFPPHELRGAVTVAALAGARAWGKVSGFQANRAD